MRDATDARTTGEARVRAMTTELLRENRAACALAVEQWGQMAAGELDEKPDCPFCEVGDCCSDCALGLFDGEHHCCERYTTWSRAINDAHDHTWVCDSMRSAPVLSAAGEMHALLVWLLAVIEDELASRTARAVDDARSREARAGDAEPVRAPISTVVCANGMLSGDRARWTAHREYGEGTVVERTAPAEMEGAVPVRFDDYTDGGGYENDGDYHDVPPGELVGVGRVAEPPGDSVVAELAWAYRHLDKARAALAGTLMRCRGKPERHKAEMESERCMGFALSATLALGRCLEFLIDEDIDNVLAEIPEEAK